MKKLILIIFLVVIVVGVETCHYTYKKNSIKEWATSQGWEVINVSGHMTTIGSPFYWQPKNTLIWELDVNNHGVMEKWWVRPGLFYDDHIKSE